jgi:hypothetical protein
MFGKRKREQHERGRRIGHDVAEYMDEQEENSWAWRTMRDEKGAEAASQKYRPLSIVATVERVMQLCDNDVNAAMAALEAWKDARQERYERLGDEDRSTHVAGMYLSVGLNGIGNLFGFIPPGAPAFDAELAAAGRERGWRRDVNR